MSRSILHLAERSRWAAAHVSGAYAPDAFGAEGFVHCCDPAQIEGVANRLYRGRDDLVLLVIEENRLAAEVRRENLEGGDEPYPHVYGPIELDAVVAVQELLSGPDGRFELSEGLRGEAP